MIDSQALPLPPARRVRRDRPRPRRRRRRRIDLLEVAAVAAIVVVPVMYALGINGTYLAASAAFVTGLEYLYGRQQARRCSTTSSGGSSPGASTGLGRPSRTAD